MERGEGATTQQMEAAPKGAIFVWCNERTDYPKLLARKIGREDLQIKSPSWLTSHVWRGVSLAGIVVDHAARLTDRECEELHYILACVRPNVCDWVPDADDCRAFETTCGNAFVLNDGDPRTNGVVFCPYCGGKLKQAVPNVQIEGQAASGQSRSNAGLGHAVYVPAK